MKERSHVTRVPTRLLEGLCDLLLELDGDSGMATFTPINDAMQAAVDEISRGPTTKRFSITLGREDMLKLAFLAKIGQYASKYAYEHPE